LKILTPVLRILLFPLFFTHFTANFPPQKEKKNPHLKKNKNSPTFPYLLESKDKVKPEDEQDNTVTLLLLFFLSTLFFVGGKSKRGRIT